MAHEVEKKQVRQQREKYQNENIVKENKYILFNDNYMFKNKYLPNRNYSKLSIPIVCNIGILNEMYGFQAIRFCLQYESIYCS